MTKTIPASAAIVDRSKPNRLDSIVNNNVSPSRRFITLLTISMIVCNGAKVVNAENSVKNKQDTGNLSQIVDGQRCEKQGLEIDFSLNPIAGAGNAKGLGSGMDAIATFKITDTRTGQPLSGSRPRAWMALRHSEMVSNEIECTDKVKSFLSGSLSKRADVDFNNYLLLTLNHDKTISIINPHISFNTTKLQNIIALPSNGADWVLSANKNFLYVTMPKTSSVAVVDTTASKLIATLATGDKSVPRRISVQPDGRYVWVGLDGGAEVVVIDTATNQIAGKVSVGAGLHNIAFTADSRFAYVTNSTANTVTAIDITKLAKITDIPVGKTPTAIAYGATSRLIYVAAINGATITVINPDKQAVAATVAVKSGIVALRFDLGGRYLLAVNQIESTLYAIDSATNTVMASTQVVKEPDQIAFTERYAYVRGLGSEKFSLIDLSELKKGKLVPVDIQAGRLPPSAEPKDIGVASMIAPTPEGNSVMIANAPDRMMYFYQEGMMAAMGTFSNYKRMPHALMILDRSLSETAPGVYTAHVKLTKGGRFDVPILIDQPRLVNCFQVTVAEQPGDKKQTAGASVQIEAQFDGREISASKVTALKFKIIDSASKALITGLGDVQALVFEPPGVWQQRHGVKELGNGIYVLDQSFPHAGVFNVMLAVPSRGVHYADLQPHNIRVMGIGKKAAKLGQAEGVRK